MSEMMSETMVDRLRRHARERGEELAFSFLKDGESVAEEVSFAALDRRARAVAAELHERLPGPGPTRLLLLFPPGLDFIVCFLGCLYAGRVAVPAHPPASRRHLPRLDALARDAEPHAILTTAGLASKIEQTAGQLAGLASLPLLVLAADPRRAEAWSPKTAPALADLALLQYTSGSTADPKGVMIQHAQLIANQHVLADAFGLGEDAVIVGWLPPYHDMGLIGQLLHPIFLGARAHLMAPAAFLQQPLRWLRAIDRHAGSVAGAPDFAYALCAELAEQAPRELDLSRWRVAFSGAEPVRAATLERFSRAFARHGFHPEAFYPCYGMAEATLMITGGEVSTPPRVVHAARDALAAHRFVAAEPGPDALALVGCGRPRRGDRLRIVDTGDRRPCADGKVGEIWYAGASTSPGYWRQDELSREVLGAHLASGEGPFLRTGDLGFLDRGELFVTGRLKDLIILRGRNLYPQDIELTVEAGHPALRPASSAAFTVDDEARGGERLVVVAELERRFPEDLRPLIESVYRRVGEAHEARLDELVLIRYGTALKTPSGKIRRRATRAAFLRGELRTIAREERAADILTIDRPMWPDRASLPTPAGRDVLLAALTLALARRVGKAPGTIERDRSLTALGLDSVSAIQLASELEDALDISVEPSRLLDGATLDSLADHLLAAMSKPRPAVPERPASPTSDHHPLSYGQRALLYLHRLDPDRNAYHLAAALRLRGPLDDDALARALEALCERHAALRSTITAGDEPEVRVLPAIGDRLVRRSTESEDQLRRWLDEAVAEPFDLARDVLWRALLIAHPPTTTSENQHDEPAADHTLVFVIHHLVTDGWSQGVLFAEWWTLYRHVLQGRPAELESILMSAADFARRQLLPEAASAREGHWGFWRAHLAPPLPTLDLPADRPRPAVQSFAGERSLAVLTEAEVVGLERLAERAGATLSSVLLGAWAVLLARHAGTRELIVGTPMTLRQDAGLARTVGYFVNPVPLRFRLGVHTRFADLLGHVQEVVREALEHRDFPFAELTRRLAGEHNRVPLVQAFFAWHRDPLPGQATADLVLPPPAPSAPSSTLGALEIWPRALERRHALFDLTLAAVRRVGGELAIELEWDSALFDATTGQRLLRQLTGLLRQLDGRARIDSLPLLDPAARHQLLVEWGRGPDEDSRAGQSLDRVLIARAGLHPERIAVVDGEERLSYAALDRLSAALAGELARTGHGEEDHLGVLMERRGALIVALLAVLRAGAGYVPLDPAYPPQRLRQIVADSQVRTVLVDPPERHGEGAGLPLPNITSFAVEPRRLPTEGAPAPAHGPSSLAYLIYTSGSTGRPKGVAITHGNALALLGFAGRCYDRSEMAGVLAGTSICFDLSVFEIFAPLSLGGTVFLIRHLLELPRLPGRAELTLINTVPSVLTERLDALPPSVRTVNLAGEPLTASLAEKILAHGTVERLLNLYGPSEDTTYSTWEHVAAGTAPTIGRPVDGGELLLLDPGLEPALPGAIGEIVLGGAGLSRGYHARPALTAERFVPHPWSPAVGARVYRTGDLGRFRMDGRVQFLGRRDHQVKIRGFRIELGEIEHVLEAHSAVERAAVVVYEAPSGPSLGAFLTGPAGMADDLRAWLSERLPAFMVPARIQALDRLPASPNGKIDRRALSELAAVGAPSEPEEHTPPETEIELLLANIWREVLGVERIGIHDSFFALGGHSLLAGRILDRIEERLGIALALRALMEDPTIHGLTHAIAEHLLAEADPNG